MDVSSYLKLPEVAMRLGISEKTARRYIKSGALPSIFVGNAYRVHPDDLAAFVRQESAGHATMAGVETPKAQAPPSIEPSINDVLKEEKRREELDNLRALLADAGASTSHLALPEEEFQALWKDKTAAKRARVNQQLLEERRLVKPLLARWVSMPLSEERTRLHHLWEQVYLVRLLTAVEKNQEAAQAEANAARREGNEVRAAEVLREAEEFARVA